MQALFVHGMGRTPLSGWPILRQLKRAGIASESFGYFVSVESFEAIRSRLVTRLCSLAKQGNYVVIGHSLGGVLLRAALAALPKNIRQPQHLFLLASPIYPARLAQKLARNSIYRGLTGDCGQLLASGRRMGTIGAANVPTTAIVGIRGLPWKPDPFAGEPNDGIVALSEVSADWLHDQVQIKEFHTVMPSSRNVGEIILSRIAAYPP